MDNSKEDFARGEAARIRARLDAPDCSAAELVQADQWLREDPVNERAFRQVHAVSVQLAQVASHARFQQMAERAMALGATLSDDSPDESFDAVQVVTPGIQRVVTQRSQTRACRKYAVPLSLAASTVIAACAIWFSSSDPVALESSATAVVAEIFNAPDKTPREVTLADGSVVHIDAGAAISVALSASERRIQLLSGRAFFAVAHDARRPFMVTANGTETVALGTQFEVRMQGAQTEVTLLEGSVAVSGPARSPGKAPWRERLTPGEQLRVASGAAPVRDEVDANNVISWSRGWLEFRSTPLTEAIAQINRYSAKQVMLADASLAEFSVAGSFIAGDSESILSAIAEVLPIRVVDGGSREVLLFRRYDR
jgi:transmembrane sensor